MLPKQRHITCNPAESSCEAAEGETGQWLLGFTYHIIHMTALLAELGIVEVSLGKFVDEKKTQLLKNKGLPIEGCAVVAARTDKDVYDVFGWLNLTFTCPYSKRVVAEQAASEMPMASYIHMHYKLIEYDSRHKTPEESQEQKQG
ncbi:hypothetical protein V8G54_012240 [Vigna mungo]|uniref:Uncharacterized protein n=1 Tax=Vigna mungo TaxID=3915 RepID=A0AAQ3S3U0_VIGMU